MRKFGIEKIIDTSPNLDWIPQPAPCLHLTVAEDDGMTIDLGYSQLIDESTEDYFGIERQLIRSINEKLEESNLPKMTADEARSAFVVQPQKTYSLEQLQRLSGFTVEKKITYYNDLGDE